ncbi:branched-chain amino acid ABC transporter permease (plasmid) [Agrobacterium fabrum]|uniref:branched-chain amino acid ABC transporter permease n=1 Tax=Agrobacterium fabrum TaxID=1176649 RepID=UPI0021D0A864|nr:branched-chain amino acid ABC transporter permease [Agrobacterium fabrum]UXT61171.1 branched-chain amino acid ABC transporter permease [Agrobacterium fabrum]
MSSEIVGSIQTKLSRKGRWRIPEMIFWLVAAGALILLPERHLILNEIAILGLFALSLDLILGYAGIVSLGHAAFFGLGAYVAGLLTIYGVIDPLLGLVAAAAVAALLGFATSFLMLRGTDLTKLMVSLGVALVLFEIANQAAWLTGGADGLQGVNPGPLIGVFEFDIFGTTACVYSFCVTFVLFVLARRIVVSPYGLSIRSIRENSLRARAIGIPVKRRLVAVYTLSAAYAGVAGALLAQTTQFVSLDVLSFNRSAEALLVLVIGGAGYLYGGLAGAVIFKVLQEIFSAWTPQYWQFWIGLVLVIIVLIGRERMNDAAATILSRWKRPAVRHLSVGSASAKASARPKDGQTGRVL